MVHAQMKKLCFAPDADEKASLKMDYVDVAAAYVKTVGAEMSPSKN